MFDSFTSSSHPNDATDVNENKVALGLSGGVDSSACISLLKQQGKSVIGVTARFLGSVEAHGAIDSASYVCRLSRISHAIMNAEDEFDEAIVQPFISCYAKGYTPSPCVHCNALLKLPQLLSAANARGCAYIATGHYARVKQFTEGPYAGRWAILQGMCKEKDQSYMLAMVSQEVLSRLLLPLGEHDKEFAREVARIEDLPCADAAESQDICFAPYGYRTLLNVYGIKPVPGDIVMRDGTVVGTHTGLADYTVGQRKGLGVAGSEPYYVIEKRASDNTIVIGTKDQAMCTHVLVGGMVWQALDGIAEGQSIACQTRIRYRMEAVACEVVAASVDDLVNTAEVAQAVLPCVLSQQSNAGHSVQKSAGEDVLPVSLSPSDCVVITLAQQVVITAPGQVAVLYDGDIVLGGGTILKVW